MVYNENFLVFHLILMKLGGVLNMDNYNFTKFHPNQMKNKKVLLIARFSVQNFKVSVELRKSYIVLMEGQFFRLEGGSRVGGIGTASHMSLLCYM